MTAGEWGSGEPLVAGRVVAPARPAIIPFRWVGHGVDVCVVADKTEPRFIARDILEAAGQEVGEPLASQPSHHGPMSEHAQATAWSVPQIHNVLEALGEAATRSLFAFLDARAMDVATMKAMTDAAGLREPVLLPGVDPASVGTPAPAPEDPRTFSIAAAAKILDRDPAISLGRDSLFDWMSKRGWVDRRGNAWIPNRDVCFIGYLTSLQRRIPGQHDLYPQVLVTDLGMQAIHGALNGVGELNLDRTHLTLIEETE